MAWLSGMRDHGATSTTVQTASISTAARTWRILRAGARAGGSSGTDELGLRPDRLGELAQRSI